MARAKPQPWAISPTETENIEFWRELVFCAPVLDGSLYDFAGRTMGTKTGAPTVRPSVYGRALNFPSSAGATFADHVRYRTPSSAITIAVAYTKTAINLFDSGHVLGKTGANVNEGSWSINTLDDDTQNPRFSFAQGDFDPVSTGGVSVATNTPVLAVGRWRTGTAPEIRVYNLLTGGLIGTASAASTTATINYSTPGPISLSCRGSTPGNFVQGHFYAGYVWSRRLTDAEVQVLVSDPWAPVRPRLSPLLFVGAAPSGSSVSHRGASAFADKPVYLRGASAFAAATVQVRQASSWKTL